MGMIFGIIIAIATLPAAWLAGIAGPNANFNTGRSDNKAALVVFLIGEAVAAALIYSHYHPLGW